MPPIAVVLVASYLLTFIFHFSKKQIISTPCWNWLHIWVRPQRHEEEERIEREIRIRYGFFPIKGKLLVLRAEVSNGTHLRWRCTTPAGGDAIPSIYLPASCRDGAS